MTRDFERCVTNKGLVVMEPDPAMIEKEMKGAVIDIQTARKSIANEDYKWAMVQAYYSMFHAAKALVLIKGYREKSHICLKIALDELYCNTGIIDPDIIEDFEIGMEMRLQADYALDYDEESTKLCLENAETFLEIAQKIVGE